MPDRPSRPDTITCSAAIDILTCSAAIDIFICVAKIDAARQLPARGDYQRLREGRADTWFCGLSAQRPAGIFGRTSSLTMQPSARARERESASDHRPIRFLDISEYGLVIESLVKRAPNESTMTP